MYSTFSFI